MKSNTYFLPNIPAVLYGESSKRCFLFIHGKLGCKEEAAAFAEIACPRGWQVLGIDLPEHGERKRETDSFDPWHVLPELRETVSSMRKNWDILGLRANSIGAWFAMKSFRGAEFSESLFVSPILDLEALIQNMMSWAGVTEELLKGKQTIATNFGETLSWKYYQFVKEHPLARWESKTHILYAGKDAMTSREVANEFVRRFHASITVMEDGEHWFHTPEQLQVLREWEAERVADVAR